MNVNVSMSADEELAFKARVQKVKERWSCRLPGYPNHFPLPWADTEVEARQQSVRLLHLLYSGAIEWHEAASGLKGSDTRNASRMMALMF